MEPDALLLLSRKINAFISLYFSDNQPQFHSRRWVKDSCAVTGTEGQVSNCDSPWYNHMFCTHQHLQQRLWGSTPPNLLSLSLTLLPEHRPGGQTVPAASFAELSTAGFQWRESSGNTIPRPPAVWDPNSIVVPIMCSLDLYGEHSHL